MIHISPNGSVIPPSSKFNDLIGLELMVVSRHFYEREKSAPFDLCASGTFGKISYLTSCIISFRDFHIDAHYTGIHWPIRDQEEL